MKLEEFIKLVGEFPVIDTEILLAGVSNPRPFKVQISRWQRAGKLIQLKRGVYLLGAAYRKVKPYEPYIAFILKKPSYISLEKALEYYGLIPEAVKVYTSVTTKRQGRFTSKFGIFNYKHIQNSLFWGYNSITMNGQTGFIASPEKALLDLIYLRGVKISPAYLKELRLQNVEKINLDELLACARRFKKPGMLQAAKKISEFIQSEQKKVKVL